MPSDEALLDWIDRAKTEKREEEGVMPIKCPKCSTTERDLMLVVLELARMERVSRHWQKEFNLSEHPIPLTPSLKALTRVIRRLREDR